MVPWHDYYYYFIFTAPAQPVSCVHKNEITRSNSNINEAASVQRWVFSG